LETLTWRQELLKLPYVSRCWVEWNIEKQKPLETFVVEVPFDTDKKSPRFNSSALREIGSGSAKLIHARWQKAYASCRRHADMVLHLVRGASHVHSMALSRPSMSHGGSYPAQRHRRRFGKPDHHQRIARRAHEVVQFLDYLAVFAMIKTKRRGGVPFPRPAFGRCGERGRTLPRRARRALSTLSPLVPSGPQGRARVPGNSKRNKGSYCGGHPGA
jgi:hypothetical protein